MTVWTYDGAGNLSVTFDSTPGQQYALSADTSAYPTVNGTAVGSTFTLALTNADSGLAGGEHFDAYVVKGDGSDATTDHVAASVFTVGVTGEYGTDTVWTYDSATETVTATFTTPIGITLQIAVVDASNSAGGSSFTGDGSVQTLTVTLPGAPTSDFFYAECYDTGSANADGYMNRLFTPGVSGAGTRGNPPLAPAPPIPPSLRKSPCSRARIIVTDLDGVVTTWLERNHLGATVTAQLDQPWQITAAVRSADPAVNTIFSDGFPLIAQSNRLIYVLLRENLPGSSAKPWVCEASGILMSPQDQADSDIGTTHFTAYDPWQYLKGVPCFNDDVGGRIPPGGRLFTAAAFPDGAAQIAAQLLSDSIKSLNALGYGPATGPFIDLPLHDVGGGGGPYATSGHYTGGGVHPTPPITFTVQQGAMLGDVWDQLVAAGSDITGTSSGCDIVLDPIYDPVLRPGFTSELAVYPLAGVEQPKAPMGWARFTRTSVTADRQHDGTPGAFINIALFGAGQGGADGLGTIQVNAAAVAAFYSYWSQQFFPGQPIAAAVNNLAIQALTFHKQGTRSYLVDPDPLRAGCPLRDYEPGDRIPVLAPDSLRVANAGYQRVQTIPLQINPDGSVMVAQLLCCPDWRGDSRSALSLTPTSGAAGTTGVTIVASNFAALHALTVHVGGLPATITGGGTTDASGDATVTFTIPALPLGDQTVYVSDGSSTAESPTPFTVV